MNIILYIAFKCFGEELTNIYSSLFIKIISSLIPVKITELSVSYIERIDIQSIYS